MASIKFNPPVIAHRGASAYAPENTLAAFKKAAELGVQWVEFDVMLTQDNIPVIFHDDLIDRTTDGSGLLQKISSDYLATLDAGAWFDPAFAGERIPTFASLLAFLQSHHINANIEIKASAGQENVLVNEILKTIAMMQQKPSFEILFSSFSISALTVLRSLAPDCSLGLLLDHWHPNWQEISSRLNCASIHVDHTILTQQMAAKIKKMDKLLLCYTVNDAGQAETLFSLGVDAVFSDVPDKIIKILK